MSKKKAPKKKVVVPKQKKVVSPQAKKTVTPRTRTTSTRKANVELLYGKRFYMWMGIGIGLIFLGLLLMSGGKMPSPDVWDNNIIYGFRRTVLGPIFILAGLGVEIYAIFKK